MKGSGPNLYDFLSICRVVVIPNLCFAGFWPLQLYNDLPSLFALDSRQ